MGGQTFQFSENGPQGLMGGHKALLVQSSGSVYSTGPLAPLEQSYPFLRTVFGMLGFDSTDIVRAEGTMDPNIGPDVAVERACAELEQKTARVPCLRTQEPLGIRNIKKPNGAEAVC